MTFKLKSGNRTSFKNMGSSPLKTHDGTKSTTTHYADGSPKSGRGTRPFGDGRVQPRAGKDEVLGCKSAVCKSDHVSDADSSHVSID